MPDDVLNLSINVNTASIEQLKTSLKGLKSEISTLPPTSPEFKEGAAQAGQMSARLKDLNYQMNGLSGTVKAARFEHRMLRFAIFEVVGGISALGQAIDDIAGGGDKMGKFTKSLQGGFAAGMGVKFGLDMLGESFKAFSGPVGIAVGLFTAIAPLFKKAGDESADAAAKIKEQATAFKELVSGVNEWQARMGTTATGGAVNAVTKAEKQLAEANLAGIKAAMAGTIDILTRMGSLTGLAMPAGYTLAQQQAFVTSANAALLRTNKENVLILAEELKYYNAMVAANNQLIVHPPSLPMPRALPVRGAGATYTLGMAPEPLYGQTVPLLPEPAMQPAMTSLLQFESAAQVGINLLANNISTTIGDAFAKVFGGAKTLLGSFVGAFTDALTNMAAQIMAARLATGMSALIGGTIGLGELIPFLFGAQHGGVINEPIVGRGMQTGGVYTFGESGPERITPMSHEGGGGMPYVTVIPIVNSSGLAVQVEVGNRINNRRRF